MGNLDPRLRAQWCEVPHITKKEMARCSQQRVGCFPQGLLKSDPLLPSSAITPAYMSRRLGRRKSEGIFKSHHWLGIVEWVPFCPSKAKWGLLQESHGWRFRKPSTREIVFLHPGGRLHRQWTWVCALRKVAGVTCIVTAWWGRVIQVSCVWTDSSALESFCSTPPVMGLIVTPPKKFICWSRNL